MARKRKPTGDDAYNARRRYYRKAETYLKQAQNSTGATAARYRELARANFNDALKTYEKGTTQKFSKPMQRIANALGVDLGEERRKTQSRSKEASDKIRSEAIKLGRGSKSEKALRKRDIDSETLRQDEARTILSSPIGKRIIGGTESIWRDEATIETDEGLKIDKSRILPALYKWFQVDNLADLLEAVENVVQDRLYADESTDMMYEVVKLLLANHIESSNKMVA